MDDIMMYNSTLGKHVDLFLQVFEILHQNEFHLKLSKCAFAQLDLEYLGHIFSVAGVPTKPTKVLAIATWPSPKIVNNLRGFLGLVTKPFENLLRKCTIF